MPFHWYFAKLKVNFDMLDLLKLLSLQGFKKGALQEQINTLKIREKVIHKIYENKNFYSKIKNFVD